MLYLAYGSNLNIAEMNFRCPTAIPIKPIVLNNWRLVFKEYADIIYQRNYILNGVIWNISKQCEDTLDKYEGIEDGLYIKKYLTIDNEKVLVYVMNNDILYPPYKEYYNSILEGYNNFNIPKKFLEEALIHSFEEM